MNICRFSKKALAVASALALSFGAFNVLSNQSRQDVISAADSAAYEWDTLRIGGAGFVSGIVTGQKEMYLRTDVGGCYRYDYDKKEWVQLFGFLTESERGFLSCKGIAIDPTDDMTAYFLCGCAYFSDARTVIFKTTDGGRTFTRSDVTDLIQVHGNGDGRECIEPIAIDPDNPDTIYAGGDVTAGSSALIKSTDGGKTWKPVDGYDALGLFPGELKYPMWTDHMVRGTEPAKEYNQQNGIGCVYIEGGKVYVGTSVTGQANIHVASVKDDKFEPVKALPDENYPLSITSDHNGNLFFTYIAGLAFAGTAGGAYKYNIKTGSVEKLSVSDSAIGMIEVDKNNPEKMFARTCGVWSDQWFEKEWTDGSIAWGDHFFRSDDGGTTWEDITPGQGPTDYTTGNGVKNFISLPIDTNGYDWIYGKACHWGSGILIDPRDKEGDRILMTSGNGVYACDNAWDEKGIQFYFQPDGVEECVSLDFVSVPGGENYSVIGDYDGFIHADYKSIPEQYKPNMGSTCAIAYCPQNPDVMFRVAEHTSATGSSGYYTLDAGKTWNPMKCSSGGKGCITQLADGTYRFIKSSDSGAAISYSDDFGATWKEASGMKGDKTSYPMVNPTDPSVIYASSIIYNSYWGSDPAKKEPSFEECHYSFFVSSDYGATWTEKTVAKYDMCDHTGDLAYISDGKCAMAVGWNGLYFVSDNGENIEKSDVFYCKTVGCGAPEKAGGPNTLFIYGRPSESDPEGIYRSTDAGKSWICINTDHLYGGTGNGNYICGDMNEFGTMYMSTVGCGIVYGKLSDGTAPAPTVKPTASVKPSPSAPASPSSAVPSASPSAAPSGGNDTDKTLYGDVDLSGTVDVTDLSVLSLSIVDKGELTGQALINADVNADGKAGLTDLATIKQYVSKVITVLGPEK